MTLALRVIGFVAAIVLIAASAAMNFFFASGLGQGPIDGLILGCVSVALDVMKALLALYVAQAAATGRKAFALIGGLVFVLTSLLSLTASLGFTSTNRSIVIGAQNAKARELLDLEMRAEELKAAKLALPAHRAKSIVDALMVGAMSDRKWRDSGDCSNPRGSAHHTFCQLVMALRAERAAAEEFAKIDSELMAMRSRITDMRRTGASVEGDAQARLMAAATGLDEATVRRMLLALLAVVVEVTSGLALYLAEGPGRPKGDERRQTTTRPDPKPDVSEARIALAVPPNIKLGDRKRRRIE